MRLFWHIVHNLIAHPMLILLFNSRLANWFHDITANLAYENI